MFKCCLCDSPTLAGGVSQAVLRVEAEPVAWLAYCYRCCVALNWKGVADFSGRLTSLQPWARWNDGQA